MPASWQPEGWDDPDRAEQALERLARDINHVRPRARPITARERQVLSALALGLTRCEAAAILGLAPSTIARHLQRARAALGAKNTTHAITRAFRTGQLE